MARDTLAAKSAEDLWMYDLDMFEAAYEKFAAARVAARDEVAASSKGAVVKKRVVRAKKTA